MTTRPWAFFLASVSLAAFVSGCKKSETTAPAAPPPPVPVSVATATTSDVPVLIRTIGSAQAKASVVLKTQVAGRVAEILAPEGAEVKAGQPLLKLDEAWFMAAIKQKEADLAQSRAMATDAHNLEERNRSAMASAALSQREFEQTQAKAAAADAEVAAKQADVDTAKLNLAYCSVAAPFAGRLGQFLVKPGAIVKENDTELVEINQIDPIEVAFSIPEQRLPAIRAAMAKPGGPLRVEVTPSGDVDNPIAGELSFIDSKVDSNTGTIRLKATFQNQSHRLWPGRFTNVTLFLTSEPGSVLIPESAIQSTQAGTAVFVVKPDKTVELRPVTIRRALDGKSIIEQGISADEVVVIDGQLRLKPGTSVQVRTPAAKS